MVNHFKTLTLTFIVTLTLSYLIFGSNALRILQEPPNIVEQYSTHEIKWDPISETKLTSISIWKIDTGLFSNIEAPSKQVTMFTWKTEGTPTGENYYMQVTVVYPDNSIILANTTQFNIVPENESGLSTLALTLIVGSSILVFIGILCIVATFCSVDSPSQRNRQMSQSSGMGETNAYAMGVIVGGSGGDNGGSGFS